MKVRVLLEDDESKDFSLAVTLSEVNGFPVEEAKEFTVTVTREGEEKYIFSGEGSVLIRMPCDRCLKEIPVEVPFCVDEAVNPLTKENEDGDSAEFFDEFTLDGDLLILPEIRLNLPMKVLCKEDCKGICLRCGKDLNEGKCSCDAIGAPTKMAEALQKAFEKNKFGESL